MASVTAEEAPRLRPYMRLAEQLGSFAGQLTETGLEAVTISYAGHAASLNTRPLTQVVLTGLLRPLLASVNMVNAPALAKQPNIDVRVVTSETVHDYQTLLTVEVVTERGVRAVSGTLFQDLQPRLVAIRGIPVEARLGPHMLYVRNQDKPGLIGALGSTLGDAGINIATFHLGRVKQGGDAIALVEVAEEVRLGAGAHLRVRRALRQAETLRQRAHRLEILARAQAEPAGRQVHVETESLGEFGVAVGEEADLAFAAACLRPGAHHMHVIDGHHGNIVDAAGEHRVAVFEIAGQVVERACGREGAGKGEDGNGLAGDVLDVSDRAVFQHVEDRLDLVVDAVRRIGGDKVVATGNRVQHGRGRRTADLDVA